jgi:hypothetical protein
MTRIHRHDGSGRCRCTAAQLVSRSEHTSRSRATRESSCRRRRPPRHLRKHLLESSSKQRARRRDLAACGRHLPSRLESLHLDAHVGREWTSMRTSTSVLPIDSRWEPRRRADLGPQGGLGRLRSPRRPTSACARTSARRRRSAACPRTVVGAPAPQRIASHRRVARIAARAAGSRSLSRWHSMAQRADVSAHACRTCSRHDACYLRA